MIAWIIDTFETSSGRSLTDVKDKLLSISGVTITRQEYDNARIQKKGRTEKAEFDMIETDTGAQVVQTIQRYRWCLP